MQPPFVMLLELRAEQQLVSFKMEIEFFPRGVFNEWS